MSALEHTHITSEQYLEIEYNAEFRSEYFAGRMFTRSGASEPHNVLVTNLITEINVQFRRRPCRVYSTDMKVRVSETSLFTYPDVIALCGEPELLNRRQDVLLNPTVIAEVLSPSTELYDRTGKFEHYRRLPTLTDYLLVSQQAVKIEHYARQDAGQWLLTVADGPKDMIVLESVGCRLLLADIYEKVTLETVNPLQMRPGGLTEEEI